MEKAPLLLGEPNFKRDVTMKLCKVIYWVGIATLASTQVYAQEQTASLLMEIERYLASEPGKAHRIRVGANTPLVIPADLKKAAKYDFQQRMAISGHGVLHDINGERVSLKESEIDKLQQSMLKHARKKDIEQRTLDVKQQQSLKKVIKVAQELVESQRLNDTNRLIVLNVLLRAESYKFEDAKRSEYLWRAQFLRNELSRKSVKELMLIPRVKQLEATLANWILDFLGQSSPYIRDCKELGVPVPPDFKLTSSEWQFQGPLTTNLLDPGQVANVWTWHEPGERGACVALPRGDGGPGSLTGIICQGAETGNACFWDNLNRGSSQRIPWATETLRMAKMQDGSVLASSCTGCHKGNNVFLVSPDDPTWCRLLRGRSTPACAEIDGTDTQNYTLAVESPINTVNVPNTSLFHSRYQPYSGNPPRNGWANDEVLGCGGVCHLGGSAVTPPPMPPDCTINCY